MWSLMIRMMVGTVLLLPAGALAAPAVQLPQTGQTSCWGIDAEGNPTVISCTGTGQDAEKLAGAVLPAAPRFTEPTTPNGTLTDKLTDLVWLKNADCLEGAKTWQEALTTGNTLASGICGLSDNSVAGQWRLPNRKELLSLTNFEQALGDVWLNGQGFVDGVHDYYWTSDTFVFAPTSRWVYHPVGDSRRDTEAGGTLYRALYVRDMTTLTVTPATQDLGNVAVGQTSAPQTFAIANTGSGPVNVSGITVAGTDGAMFAVAPGSGEGACASLTPTILPAASCTVTVTFTPASDGAKTAALRVASNADNSPVREAALTGTGMLAITASVEGANGTITSTNPAIVASGTTASFTLEPAAGFRPAETVGGTCPAGAFSGTTYTTGTIASACTVSFSFVPRTFNISTASGEGGTITCTPSTTVNMNTAVSCTATAGANFHLTGVTVDGAAQTLAGTTAFTHDFGAVTADHTIAATFAANPPADPVFTVTFAAATNGTINGTASQSVTQGGSSTQVVAVPAAGFHFVNWTGPNGFTSTANPLVLANVTADQTITANFEANAPDVFVVTPTVDEHGAFTPAAPQTVSLNGTTAFTVQPLAGYHLASVEGCGGTLSGSTYTTGPVTANCTVTATFVADTIEDVTKAYAALVNNTALTDEEKVRYDVAPLGDDGKPKPDGIVDVADVVIMLRRLAGLVAW